ncbi:biogenesis of lysosome-related organelles complex 1 subunit 3 [Bradysia coprophila]|uniref:biogenesis of lysosome-related organelles complex 1 subunit 3 n=1 Tax=Bradysia coprophila TaxID=38358 RepID=UPI00187D6FFF|nr:biogenesis of lysosome-related organelles complex 1 subunit 3 [Bradysia coprophila]
MVTPESFVVQGEAAESDDDESNTNYKVTIVDGEAPESDEEIASFSNLPSVNHMGARFKPNHSPLSSPIRIRSVEESLLHKKLCERNLSLWNSLNALIQSTVSGTSKKLIATDQLLVQSQVTLQTASRTIKKVNETTAEVADKFKSIVDGNFIPPITLS